MGRKMKLETLIWCLALTFVPFLYAIVLNRTVSNLDMNASLDFLGQALLAVLCILYLKKKKQLELFRIGKPKLSYILLTLLSFLLLLIWNIISYKLFPASQNTTLILKSWNSSEYMKVLMPFVAIIGAPIYEDIAVRALPMQLLKPYSKFGLDIIVSSSMFAIGHLHGLSITDFLIYFVMGVIHCLLVRKTHSIYYSIGLHSMWNGFIYFGRLLFGVL